MKTKTILLTAALVAAGVASSMAQSNVYSLNIVGYVNIPVLKGKAYMLNNPFDTGTGNNITNVLVQPFQGGVGDVPDPTIDAGWDGSQFYTFKQGVGYINDTYSSGFGWSNGGNDPGTADGGATTSINPGLGFWLIPTTNSTVTFTGSVVLSSSSSIPHGPSQVGSAYAGALTLSALGLNGNDGDTIYRWYTFPLPAGNTGSLFHYGNGIVFSAGYGWYDNDADPNSNAGGGGGDTNGPVLNVGEGLFYINSAAAVPWNQSFTVN